MPNIAYSAFLMVAGLICLIVGVLVFQKRPFAPGSKPLMVILFAMSWWDITYSIFWAGIPGPTPFFWLDMTVVGPVAVPTALLIFSMELSGLGNWLKKPFISVLFVEPLLTLILLWTDPWHGLFFGGKRLQGSGMIPDGGPAYWGQTIYAYGLLLISFILMFRRFIQSTGIYRKQIGVVIAGLGIVWLNSIVFLLGYSPFPNADNTPFSFTLAGVAFTYAILHYRLLDIIPIAHSMLIEKMSDGVVVLGANNFVVDINPVAKKILGSDNQPIIGEKVEKVFSAWPELVKTFLDVNNTHTEISFGDPAQSYYDLQISPMFDNNQNFIGRLIVWRDISELKKTQADLEKLVTQDTLTSVYNRRHFYTLAEMELLRTIRFKSNCSIILIDLDRFKKINDKYGHQSGDQALIIFTKTCREHIRKVDVLARLGGEEFAILLPETDTKQAQETAERIRAITSNTTIETGGNRFKISASFGISTYKDENDTLETLLRKADQALYHAKNTGRNRVAVWHAKIDRVWLKGKFTN